MGTQASKKSSGVAFQSQETIRERAARERCQVPALKARGDIGELETPSACARFSTLRVQAHLPTAQLANSLWRPELAEPRRFITHLKYMADARIFEFESSQPSHAVWSPAPNT
jgi:hypothetical protein